MKVIISENYNAKTFETAIPHLRIYTYISAHADSRFLFIAAVLNNKRLKQASISIGS